MRYVFKDAPAWMRERGFMGFQDAGRPGMGVPRYAGQPGWPTGSEIPTKIGARYIVGEDENDEGTIITGSKWGGTDAAGKEVLPGKLPYQKAIHDYYDKEHKALKYPDPRKVA